MGIFQESHRFDRQKNNPRAKLNFLVLDEPGGGADFDSDGSVRQTGGLTGGLKDIKQKVPAWACLTAISVSMS